MKKEIDKSSLLSQWKNKKDKALATPGIEKAPAGESIPLSRGQQRLWFLQQLYPNNSFYNHAEAYTILGDLNIEHLSKSFDLIIEQHDILKAYFPVDDGETTIKIDSTFKLKINTEDFSAHTLDIAKQKATDFIAEKIVVPFNLSSSPLIRVSLLKISEAHHILSINIHHIIIDEWSMRGLINLLAENYIKRSNGGSITAQKLPIQYQDFAYWDQNRELPLKQIEYWKQKLSGTIPLLELQTDHKRPLQPSFKGEHYTSYLSKEDSHGLLAFSKKMGTTPFVVTLSLFYTLLHRYTKQKDILIGLPITNRSDKSLENLLGFFVDTVVLRTQFNEDHTFSELLSNVRVNTLEAFSNKEVPFDYLVKELLPNRTLAINPFFQVMFVYNNDDKEAIKFGSQIEFKKEEDIHLKSSKFDLTLFINEKDGKLSTTLEFATDLFERSTIERFSEHFNLLVKSVLADSEVSISELPMLTTSEKEFFFKDKTVTNPFEDYTGIHHIIEDIAQKNPNAIAVTFGNESLTYKNLNERAITLAHILLSKKNVNDKVIALCLERSTTMIVGLLAILKSGCAYLPIDPEYPAQRIDFILKDADVNHILTEEKLINVFKDFDAELITIDSIQDIDTNNQQLPEIANSDLAYIIYTSGSTGNPKGVPITHGNILNSTAGRLEFYDNNPTAFLLMSSISFDSSKAGIFWTLCTGGNLVISEKRLEQDIDRLSSVINKHNISHTLMLPSLYNLIIEHSETSKLKSLTTVMVAGEACSVSLVKKHFSVLPNVNLYNEYGPTEATVWSIAHKVERTDISKSTIPIGKSVANADVFILDSQLRPVPIGVIGELYIGGPSLAGYYVNRPDLTATAYVKDSNGKTLYKTGDLAKYNSNGNIEFFGRADDQVKIRGFRVELNEIENVLNQNEMIKKAVVVVETKDETIDSISQLETSELAKLLNDHLDSQDIDKLLSSIELLDTNEKEYLLNQIK